MNNNFFLGFRLLQQLLKVNFPIRYCPSWRRLDFTRNLKTLDSEGGNEILVDKNKIWRVWRCVFWREYRGCNCLRGELDVTRPVEDADCPSLKRCLINDEI